MFQDKEGIPSDRQPLFFKGKQLKDRRCVTDYNIEMFSCLQMPVSLQSTMETMHIHVRLSSADGLFLEVKAYDTIHSIKAKIQVSSFIPSELSFFSTSSRWPFLVRHPWSIPSRTSACKSG